MSPAALDIPPANANANAGDALVIGSLATAADGTYQHVISSLSGRTVERQLVDRILDQAVTLENERFTDAYVVLGTDEYNVLQQRLGALLSAVLAALKPLGRIHLHNLTESREVASSGFSLLSTSSELVAQKPASAPPKSVLLPRRANVNGAGAAKKKQMLWSFAAAPPVDPETLLTPSDRVRPAPCEPADGSAARRKKACKNCTCGLAEIEAEEEARAVKVVLDATADADSVRRAGPGAAAKVTSSCGSCYLGDAFRCASCPYLGLPAFEPGQKVELVGMGDDF